MKNENLSLIVPLNEASQLKHDLNMGVASLIKAEDINVRPHICLNDFEGVKIIEQIAKSPGTSNTYFSLSDGNINYSGHDGMWLNLGFFVQLKSPDDNESSRTHVFLSPRQTGHIVLNLPPESQTIVLGKVIDWYQGVFLPQIQRATDQLSKQVSLNTLLVKGTDNNRIFDIHDGNVGHEDVHYSEVGIIGSELFYKFFLGHTFLQSGDNGYERIDDLLSRMRAETKGTVEAFMRTSH